MSDANRCNWNRRSSDAQYRLMMAADSQPTRKSSLSIHDARIAGLYDLEQTIGRGHFAVVKLASHVFTGEKVAVKVIDKTKFDATMASHFMKEVRCMKLVQHPNIVRLYEVIDTHTKLFLILELGDYDMYDFIMKNADKGCPENEAQQYFCQIIKAIDYCHKLHVVHRDLKPENVVFFEKLGMVKLTDFGFSNKFTPGEQLATSCGSLAYSAPEILLGDAYDAPAVDVWSLGVILYMLLCGRLPFQEANDSETLTKILDCIYSLPETLSVNARNLISRMLVKDASKRATLKEIVENQWVAAGERGLAQVLPLVGRDILPESAHATIIEQMVAGGVDTEEHILRSLENDDYSYTTATYYLLAERVLSSYREERAREVLSSKPTPFNDLATQPEIVAESSEPSTSMTAGGTSAVGATRCRSRSNSWRGNTATTRRPCTILKEESEEELSSYLRTSSRQSSRYFHGRLASGEGGVPLTDSIHLHRPLVSRQNKAIISDSLPNTADVNISAVVAGNGGIQPLGTIFSSTANTSSTGFEELSPVCELEFSVPHHYNSGEPLNSDVGDARHASVTQLFSALEGHIMAVPEQQARASKFRSQTSMKPPAVRTKYLLARDEGESQRMVVGGPQQRRRSVKMLRANSAPAQVVFDNYLFRSTPAMEMLWRINRPMFRRRNSSPSISMFGGINGSKERISPQAIQDLLELSRLSVADGRRRALSPDSRRSSRSPSPPSSSGRSSPAVGVGRMKTSLAGTGNMRKLSSSPHLLGICEESEESEQPSGLEQRHTITRRSVSSASGTHVSQARIFSPAMAASDMTSTGSTTMLTYSKVRMIRPRQAVVSPDMARRYEPHPSHRFQATRTRRSTSCSSSEASDDDSSERRMNLLVSKCCHYTSDDPNNDDDPSKGSRIMLYKTAIGFCSSSEASDDDSSERRMNLLVSKCCHYTSDDPNNDDDPSKGGGGNLAGAGSDNATCGLTVHRISAESGTSVQTTPNSGGGDGATKCKRCLTLRDATETVEGGRHLMSTPLHPIMEIPSTLLSGTIFARSETAKRAVADWACSSLSDGASSGREWIKRCVATPPRFGAGTRACEHLNCECVRSLRKSRSLPIFHSSFDEQCLSSYYDSDEDIYSDEELDSSLCWTSTDSGCSSEGETDTFSWRQSLKTGARRILIRDSNGIGVVPSYTPVLLS
ncbi:SNF-related serine/threonine-protein kinase [Toxocara canis]|uniref:SNF-related serine/threonine-protein kinase n=1 Tax=Toxocara canis TaxID=6265 RepID=A0A0B2VTP4_TOXCA|nr:SNF-related serine/threonine-protein kinase [Toxocara canis]